MKNSLYTARLLILASIVTLSSINCAYSAPNDSTAPEQEDNSKGTLDKLAGQDIPNSDPVAQYPADGSAYTLTKVDSPGENTITKFEWDESSQSFNPVFYQVNLKKTQYGEGEQSKSFTINTTPLKGVEITAKYDLPTDKTYTTEYKGKHYEGSGDNTADYKEIHSPVQNMSGDPISIEDTYFKNNSSTITTDKKNVENVGGAIYNAGSIENIRADFSNNSVTINSTVTSNYVYASGGAIYNDKTGTIGDITGIFSENNAQSNRYAQGGAIYNKGQINNINADFIANYASGNNDVLGGAIYNSRTIGNITGDFIANYASGKSYAYGGAIYNSRTIGDITGDFIANYASGDLSAYGGAIYNYRTIGDITGDFIANYASSENSYASGGAIYNYKGTIGDITGDFIGNYASGNNSANGGAIDNNGKLENITGDFIANYASSENSGAYGGAIYNYSNATIGNITGDFIANYASGKSSAEGGAILNSSTIGDITGDFIANYAKSGDSSAGGGAIGNGGTLGDITGNFVGNYAEAENGIAIGGAIYNVNTISKIKGDFIDNHARGTDAVMGGAIFNAGNIGVIQGSFINNSAESQSGKALGGAIFSTSALNVIADNSTSLFSGNKTVSNGTTEQNAISLYGLYITKEVAEQYGLQEGFVDINTGTITKDNPAALTLTATNNGEIVFDDTIRGGALDYMEIQENKNYSTIETPETMFKLNITGDDSGKVAFNNDIINANISLENTNLFLGRDNVLNNDSLTLNSGSLSMINNSVGTANLYNFAVNGDTKFFADVDLANKDMDKFTAQSYSKHTGNLVVSGMNLISDAKDDQTVTDIFFAEQGLKDNVVNGIQELPDSNQTSVYTPIYKYNVLYDNREDGGHFLFTKGDKIIQAGGGVTDTGNPSDAFNPSVLASPVAAQAGAYAAQHATFNYAFQHADSFMQLPFNERLAARKANQFAITSFDNLSLDSHDFHQNAIWVRPYTSFENIPLKNGPKVDVITYGTLIGGDSSFKELANGWGTVFTGYVGYNGSDQSYDNVDTYQNGGLIGATQTFYKGNFFTALTASAGASTGESHNMYGHENFTTLMAGVASKTGYNFEFKEGKFIILPTIMLSYSFINTFDYKNSAGVNIKSDPLHAIQINPNVRFVLNCKNGWQPYASVGMVWNILDSTKVTANDVRLPEMSTKPYVEYGIGVQKRWNDKYTGYLQAMVRNGGRNGVALTGGFRWAIGKDSKPVEKVYDPNTKTSHSDPAQRKVIKKLSSAPVAYNNYNYNLQ